MATAFPDVKPWPKASEEDANPRATIGDNSVPMDVEIVGQFDEAIDAKPGLRTRINELIGKADTLPDCTNDDLAGRLGDFVKMCTNAAAIVNDERERVKAPYLAATRALDAKGNAMRDQLNEAKAKAKAKLDKFVAEQAERDRAEQRRIAAEQAELRRVAEERARAEAERERKRLQAIEDARAAAEQREAAAVEVEPEPVFVAEPEPAPTERAPVARGDLGSRVGMKTIWKHEIENVRQVPDHLLKHPTVVEALSKVVAAQVRSGIRAIKGVRIWSEQTANVR